MVKINKEGKDIFTLSIGALIAQLIPVIASIVLTRIYSAEQFGDWGIFLSYSGILSILVMGQYEMAIVRPHRERDAENVVRLCFAWGLLFSVALYAVFIVSDCISLSYFRSIPSAYLLPLFVFLSGMLQVYLHYANRKENYSAIASSGVIRNSFQALTRIALGLLKSFYGLIHGASLGLFISIVYNEHKIPVRQLLFKGYNWQNIKRVAMRYRYFPMFLLPSALLNALSTNLPVLILTSYFPKEYIGYFSMTISLLFLPVQLVSNAMSKVFYKKSSIKNNDEEVRRLSYNLFKVSFLLGLAINVLLLLFGDSLFALVLGEKWRTSGIYSMLLSPWILMTLCFSPLSVIFDSRDRQSVEFMLNVALFLFRVSLIVYGGSVLNDMDMTVFLYGLCGFIIWAVEGYIIFRIIGLKLNARQLLFVLGSILIVILLWIARVVSILA